MLTKKCEQCGVDFSFKPYRQKIAKFCSYKCMKNGTDRKCEKCGKTFYVFRYRAKIARFCSMQCTRGKSISKKTRLKLSKSMTGRKGLSGADHPLWKGSKVKYAALHEWIRKRLINQKYCAFCKAENKKLDAANKNGKYNRNIKNWIKLCRSCHVLFDKKSPKRPKHL